MDAVGRSAAVGACRADVVDRYDSPTDVILSFERGRGINDDSIS